MMGLMPFMPRTGPVVPNYANTGSGLSGPDPNQDPNRTTAANVSQPTGVYGPSVNQIPGPGAGARPGASQGTYGLGSPKAGVYDPATGAVPTVSSTLGMLGGTALGFMSGGPLGAVVGGSTAIARDHSTTGDAPGTMVGGGPAPAPRAGPAGGPTVPGAPGQAPHFGGSQGDYTGPDSIGHEAVQNNIAGLGQVGADFRSRMGGYDTAYGSQGDALGLMRDAAMGNAPSAAMITSNQATSNAIHAQLAAAASARGGAYAQQAAAAGAAGQAGQLEAQGAGQAAQIRAQEMAQARDAYMQGGIGMGGQAISAAGTVGAQGLASSAADLAARQHHQDMLSRQIGQNAGLGEQTGLANLSAQSTYDQQRLQAQIAAEQANYQRWVAQHGMDVTSHDQTWQNINGGLGLAKGGFDFYRQGGFGGGAPGDGSVPSGGGVSSAVSTDVPGVGNGAMPTDYLGNSADYVSEIPA